MLHLPGLALAGVGGQLGRRHGLLGLGIISNGTVVNVDKRRGGVLPDWSRVTYFQTTSFGSGMVSGFLLTKYLRP